MGMKVLIAEDDIISCRALEKNLQDWDYEVIVTKNGEEAWNMIKQGGIRLAILDWTMPKMDGIELCNKIRHEYQQEKSEYIYIILLTGRDLQEDIITGLSAGADDYMTKPFSYLELKVRIQNGRRIIALEDSRLKMANTDNLTQLWNRKKIVEILEEELNRNHREGKSVGAVMLDIDRFKEINDTHGHVTGDTVLIEVASRLKKSLRNYDQIGRYGGDEFLIVLPGLSKVHGRTIGERLLNAVSKEAIQTEASSLKVSISIGMTISDMSTRPSATQVIKDSDQALYQAKQAGRNRVHVNTTGSPRIEETQ
jgi:two-component system cell cycle response regulator